jgi:hypothetical protein
LSDDRIVAIGLLTQREVEMLGQGFSRLWPLDDTPCFNELLKAIDQAEREQTMPASEMLEQPDPQRITGGS